MVNWLAANWGTLIVSSVLACIVILIIRKLVKDRKKGKSPCGCDCAHCSMCGNCHRN